MTSSSQSARTLSLAGLLALACLLVVSVACALPGTGSRQPYPPGHQLRLQVDITDQFSHLEQADVQVMVRFPTMGELAPADNAHVTCNGHDVTPRTQGAFSSHLDGYHPCLRQPAGGAYHLLYTDEAGAVTSATIPVPTNELAFRSPTDGESFHFVRTTPLVIRLAVPVPAEGGNVTFNSLRLAPCAKGTLCPYQYVDRKASLQPTAALTAIASAITMGVTQSQGECTIQLDTFSLGTGPNTLSASVDVMTPMQESGFEDAAAIFHDTTDAGFTAVADES
jgi:hypothetical protein